jgi:hypothetical protein
MIFMVLLLSYLNHKFHKLIMVDPDRFNVFFIKIIFKKNISSNMLIFKYFKCVQQCALNFLFPSDFIFFL